MPYARVVQFLFVLSFFYGKLGSCLKTGLHSIFVITGKIKKYTYVGYLIYR